MGDRASVKILGFLSDEEDQAVSVRQQSNCEFLGIHEVKYTETHYRNELTLSKILNAEFTKGECCRA